MTFVIKFGQQSFVTHCIYKSKQTSRRPLLKKLHEKSWVRTAEKEINSYVHEICVINQQLWCCCYLEGIVIFDTELNRQHTIPMDNVKGVAELSNGDVVIATRTGLHHAEVTGETKCLTHHATTFKFHCAFTSFQT